MQGDSKNARRKARRYSTPVCPSAIGERAAWRELAEGSGRITIGGFGSGTCPDGTAWQRKQAARRAGIAWTCGVNIEMGG